LKLASWIQNVITKSYLTKKYKEIFDQGQTANTPKKLFLTSKGVYQIGPTATALT